MTGFELLRLHPAAGKVPADLPPNAPPVRPSPAVASDQPEVADPPGAAPSSPPAPRDGLIAMQGLAGKSPVCGCLDRLRRTLRPHNGTPGNDRVTGAAMIYVVRLDKDQPRPPTLLASFCPFCGEGYQ